MALLAHALSAFKPGDLVYIKPEAITPFWHPYLGARGLVVAVEPPFWETDPAPGSRKPQKVPNEKRCATIDFGGTQVNIPFTALELSAAGAVVFWEDEGGDEPHAPLSPFGDTP